MDDHELLQEYVQRQSEQAFAELVGRHVNLVYSTAARLAGEPHLAQDVAQAVFLQLARKAGSVRNGRALGSWLYRVTHAATVDALRSERRRRIREREAMSRSERNADAPAAWASVGPLLDEAMRRLKPAEMDAVVLRFFEGKSLREVGNALALSEDGAQKRVGRALEKMRVFFARRGVTATAAALTTVISTNSVQAAPAGLAEKVTASSLAGAGSAGVLGNWIGAWMAGMRESWMLTGAMVVLVGAWVGQWRQGEQLQQELAAVAPVAASGAGKNVAEKGMAATDGELSDAEIDAQIAAAVRLRGTGSDNYEDRLGEAGMPWVADWKAFVNDLKPKELQRVLAKVNAVAYPDIRSGMRVVVLRKWAQSSPAATMAYAQNLPDTQQDGEVLSQIAEVWVQRNFEEAFAWFNQLPAGELRNEVLQPICAKMAETDPVAAFDLLTGKGVKTNVNSMLMNYGIVYKNCTPDQLAELSERASQLDPAHRQDAMELLPLEWARIMKPEETLAWAQAHLTKPDELTQFLSSSEALGTLVSKDVKAAQAWVAGFPEGADRDAVQGLFYDIWAKADPDAYFAYAQTLPEGDERTAAIKRLTSNLGPEYTEYVDEGSLTVAEGYLKALPEGKAREEASSSMMDRLVIGSRPYANVAMLDKLPQDLRDVAVSKIACDLAGDGPNLDDPAAAEIWMKQLPEGKDRDAVLHAIVSRHASAYPADLAPYAASVSDATDRQALESKVATAWMKIDPEAATAWVEGTDLPDSAKEKFLGTSKPASP